MKDEAWEEEAEVEEDLFEIDADLAAADIYSSPFYLKETRKNE